MSFIACLAKLQAEGKIDRERARRFQDEFDRLHGQYRKSMGDVAALDLASRDTMDALEWQALTDRRQKMMQISTQQGLLDELKTHLDNGGSAKHFAIAVMDHHEAVPGMPSVENTKGAIFRLAWSRMGDFLERYKRTLAGTRTNAAELDDVVRALRGEKVDNENAREMAGAVGDTLEWLRQQFNAAGGAIPKLKDWGLPQSHDAIAVAQAGYQAWRDFIVQHLDFSKMIDAGTNRPFTSAEALEPALQEAWKNISSQGMDNATPGAINAGKTANRHTDHRFFVFKDADAWLAYHDRFGVGTVFDAITGHIGSMSRDIAAMRLLGPNPAATVRWLGDVLRKDALPTIEKGVQTALTKDAGRGSKVLTDLWDYYSGALTAVAPENRTTARFFSGVRNWNVMSKLGGAYLSALPTDPMFAGITARFNGLPVMDQIGTYLATFNPADATHREAALHAGLIFSEMTGRAEQMWRDGKFNVHEFTARGANALLDSTLLTPHTVAAKQALGLSFMKDWAEHTDVPFAELADPKRMALERYGINAQDWDRLRAVGPMQQGSIGLLRPADLARVGDKASIDSAVKFMSLIDSETKFGTPGESLRAQAAVATLGHSTRIERGTILGELVHSSTQFKTYSVIWMMTHLERAMYGRGGMSRTSYALTLPIMLTLGGYIADSLVDLSRGETPSMVPTPQRIGRAIVRGGGAGILGDMLSAGVNGGHGATSISAFVTGPTLGAVVDPISALTLGNLGDAASGRDTHLSSELVKQLRQATPGSNAWYMRVAMNRLLLDQLQSIADPNYRKSWARTERSAAMRGNGYWWAPGATMPGTPGPVPQPPAPVAAPTQ